MKFCHHCGKQLVAGAKFCTECGTSLSSLTNKPPAASTGGPNYHSSASSQFAPFTVGRDDDEDESYIDRMAHLNIRQDALHVEIIKDNPLGESMASVVQQGILAGVAPVLESRPNITVDNSAILKDFEREAGAIRNETRQHPISKT